MKTEINGHKFEIPEQVATRIETMKVGQRVSVLKKNNYEAHRVCHGVVAGFEPFPSLPTVIVAYIDAPQFGQPTIQVAAFNEQTKDLELVVSESNDHFDFHQALSLMERREKDAFAEYKKAVHQREYFVERWGQMVNTADELAIAGNPDRVDGV